MSAYRYFKQTRPIATDEGIRARSRRGNFAQNWWAQRWIRALERLTDAGRLRRGRSYARRGQVLSLDEREGQIQARVQGSRSTPYRVTIRLDPLTDRQWEAVLDALAERALFAAQLLAGEMPQEIEEAFQAAGVSLFPSRSQELHTDCSCPDWANPCKHVAATHYILGEQFDEDPFLLFRLRGRSQEEILEGLRRRQTTDAPVLAEEPLAYTVEEAVPPLEESLERFWQLGEPLDNFPTYVRKVTTPMAGLRRLGPAPFLDRDPVDLLAPAYQAMAQAALQLAFGSQEPGGQEDGEATGAGQSKMEQPDWPGQ